MEIAVQANERQLAELQRRHAADRKQSSKQMKKDWRGRRQAFCEQIETRKAGIISEQERIRLRQVSVRFYTLSGKVYITLFVLHLGSGSGLWHVKLN